MKQQKWLSQLSDVSLVAGVMLSYGSPVSQPPSLRLLLGRAWDITAVSKSPLQPPTMLNLLRSLLQGFAEATAVMKRFGLSKIPTTRRAHGRVVCEIRQSRPFQHAAVSTHQGM